MSDCVFFPPHTLAEPHQRTIVCDVKVCPGDNKRPTRQGVIRLQYAPLHPLKGCRQESQRQIKPPQPRGIKALWLLTTNQGQIQNIFTHNILPVIA